MSNHVAGANCVRSVSVSELKALRSAEWDGPDEDGKGAIERTSYPSLCSPELSFSQMESASERFAFKLLIFPNGKACDDKAVKRQCRIRIPTSSLE